MAGQPYDYRIQVADPMAAATQGLQLGSNMLALQQQRQKAAQMQAMRERIATVAKNPNAQDIGTLMMEYPDLAEPFKKAWDTYSDGQKENKFSQGLQVYSALESGQQDVALSLLEEHRVAYLNSGMEAEAKAQQQAIDQIKANPTMGKFIIGSALGAVDAERFGKIGEELRKREQAPEELTKKRVEIRKAEAEIEKLGAESKAALLKLKQGGVDTKDVFEFEEKLRKEYTARSARFSEAKAIYANIDASAQAKNGTGDIALITSFMKMLDPGSVVRETEFANAQKTAGLLAKLKNSAKRVKDGQLLSDEERAAFANLSKQYMDAAEKQEGGVRDSLGIVVKNYGLNSENVFGVRANTGQTIEVDI